MQRLLVLLIVIGSAAMSCTKEKTDYEDEISTIVTEHHEFKEVSHVSSDGYTISIEALNGQLYKGYNEIRLKVKHTPAGKSIPKAINFLPVLQDNEGNKTSCPHKYALVYQKEENYFSGYVVFTSESSSKANWELLIDFTTDNKNHSAKQMVTVKEQTNKNLNMTSFTGNDNEQYLIALVSPQKPKVAENKLVAGIYKYNKTTTTAGNPSPFSYTEVKGYLLQLDPRMPEPSMGNHSSPNNKHLTQGADSLYHGVVNYTMTGNWTLNFIMLNQHGKIIKGTEVPKDFTPGVEGKKSELYIDILF